MFRFARVGIVLLGVVALTICATPLQAGMIGYWNFDSNVNDQSGTGNNGTVQGTFNTNPTPFGYVAGKFGSAMSFDGSTADYVSAVQSATLGSTTTQGTWNGYVMSFWVNAASTGGVPVSKAGDGAPGYGQGFMLSSGTFYHGYGTNWNSASTGSWANSTWDNIVVRWDGSYALRAYLNGVQVGVDNASTFSNVYATSTPYGLTFGGYNISRNYAFTGKIDDAALFNSALTVAECQSIYNVGNSTLDYSMADMNNLFTLYGNGSGTTTTSDGKTWKYVASGLTGTAGTLVGSAGSYSVIFADAGSAGIQQTTPSPEPSTLVLLATVLVGLLAYAWREAEVSIRRAVMRLRPTGAAIGLPPRRDGRFVKITREQRRSNDDRRGITVGPTARHIRQRCYCGWMSIFRAMLPPSRERAR